MENHREKIKGIINLINQETNGRLACRLENDKEESGDFFLSSIYMEGEAMPNEMAEKTLFWLVPKGNEVTDKLGGKWSLTSIGRKKGGEKYLSPLFLHDAPDLGVLDISSPWESRCYSIWLRFISRVKNLKDNDKLSVKDLLQLEADLNNIWVNSAYLRDEIKAIPLDEIDNPLRKLECSRQVNIACAARVNGRVRIPHVSHKGKLCPFQTPESKNIGLQLFLASEAEKEKNKSGITGKTDSTIFSIAVGMVPYPHHSDGPRLMMGGKNLKQAEYKIMGAEKALVPGYIEGKRGGKIKALKGFFENDHLRFFPYLGSNALVAIMPWEGYTYEDGLVVSESFAKKLNLIGYTEKKVFTVPITGKVEDITENIKKAEKLLKSYQDNHTYTFGEKLYIPESIKACIKESHHVTYPYHIPGKVAALKIRAVLDRNRKDVPDPKFEFCYTFSINRPLRLGDKLTGRNGNKGVVTQILKDSPVVSIGGKKYPVDLIISPCSIIGRKNLGQIVEMIHGLAIQSKHDDLLPASFTIEEETLYENGAWRKELLPILKKLGMDEQGFPISYTSPQGEQLQTRAFVGYQYIARLCHHVDKKLQARSTEGRRNNFLSQPLSGGPQSGQRLGEMENWAVLSHKGDALDLLVSLRKQGKNTMTWDRAKEFLEQCGVTIEENKNGEISTFLLKGDSLSANAAKKKLEDEDISAGTFVVSYVEKGKTKQQENILHQLVEKLRTVPLKKQDIQKTLQFFEDNLSRTEQDHPLYKMLLETKEQKEDSKGYPLDGLTLFIGRDSRGNWGIPFSSAVLQAFPDIKNLYLAALSELSALTVIDKEKASTKKRLQRSLGVLSKLRMALLVHLKGKKGLFRSHMLGHRINHSGRAVIVSDPSLPLNEVRLPVKLAVEILQNHSSLEKLELSGKIRALASKVHRSQTDKVNDVIQELNNSIKKQGGLWCILVRQPSLHRHSIQSFKFTVWNEMAVAIPPMITPGFNADFDGDTMAVYLPPAPWCFDLSFMSIKEEPGQIGDGHTLIASNLDLALGWDSLSEERKKFWREKTEKDISKELDKQIRTSATLDMVINGILQSCKNWDQELHLLQQESCSASTGSCSLSPLEMENLYIEMEPIRKKAQKLSQRTSGGNNDQGENLEEKFNELEKEGNKQIQSWIEAHRKTHLAKLVLSKAKGKASDLRQMTAFLGLQNCYSKTEGKPLAESWLTGCFWNGLSVDELFKYSYASRQSMGDKKLATAEAGYLSRQLAEGLYDTVIEKEDCKSSSGLALYLNDNNQIELNILVDGEKQLSGNAVFPGDAREAMLSIAWGRVPQNKHKPLSKKECLKHLKKSNKGKTKPFLILRSPLTCECTENEICSKCAGSDLALFPLDKPKLYKKGTPVGLISAMAIGERGTQLAMKRFHQVGAAQNENSIATLKKIFWSATKKGKRGIGKKASLQERFYEMIELLSEDQLHKKRNKELPQALIHFELALRAQNGLQEWASNPQNRWLEAISFQEVEKKLWKPGKETCHGLKAKVLLNRDSGKGGTRDEQTEKQKQAES